MKNFLLGLIIVVCLIPVIFGIRYLGQRGVSRRITAPQPPQTVQIQNEAIEPIDILQLLTKEEAAKLTGDLRLIGKKKDGTRVFTFRGNVDKVDVFIEARLGTTATSTAGVLLRSTIGNISTAFITVQGAINLAKDPDVLRVEGSQQTYMMQIN